MELTVGGGVGGEGLVECCATNAMDECDVVLGANAPTITRGQIQNGSALVCQELYPGGPSAAPRGLPTTPNVVYPSNTPFLASTPPVVPQKATLARAARLRNVRKARLWASAEPPRRQFLASAVQLWAGPPCATTRASARGAPRRAARRAAPQASFEERPPH